MNRYVVALIALTLVHIAVSIDAGALTGSSQEEPDGQTGESSATVDGNTLRSIMGSLDSFVVIPGIILGGIGSFLRECARLYSEINPRRPKDRNRSPSAPRKIWPIVKRWVVLLPIWIVCGSLLGGVTAAQLVGLEYYAIFVGALWLPIINNTGPITKIVMQALMQQREG